MGEVHELGVAGVDGEHGGPDPSGVGDPLEEGGRWIVRGDDHDRFASAGLLEPLEAHGQVGRGPGRGSPADQRGGELGQVEPPGLVVEVGGEVPGLLGRRTDEEK